MPSTAQREQFQTRKTFDKQHFPTNNDPVFQRNSIDSVSNREGKSMRWQVSTNSNSHASAGLTRSGSNDFESWQNGGLEGKGTFPSSGFAPKHAALCGRNPDVNQFNARGALAGSRNVGGGNMVAGPHSTSTLCRGAGQSSYGRYKVLPKVLSMIFN